MKRIPTILAVIVLVLVLGTYLCTFQVRSTEVAILKTMGRPSGDAITEPGLNWRLPAPIQTVVKYDNRKRVLEDKTEETSTKDGKNVILTSYTIWRVSDPKKFHENFAVEETAIRSLRSTIQTAKNEEVGQRQFAEFIGVAEGPTTPDAAAESSTLRVIEQAIRGRLQLTDQDYGIEILDFGIKKIGLPQSVTSSIFASMKTAQEKIASQYTGEGVARAVAIRSEADAAKQRILSAVAIRVSEIESQGQKKVSEYYSEFAEHPELRIFLDNLRAAKKALATRTTLIFDTQGLPFSVFLPPGREAVLRGEVNQPMPIPSEAAGTEPANSRKDDADDGSNAAG